MTSAVRMQFAMRRKSTTFNRTMTSALLSLVVALFTMIRPALASTFTGSDYFAVTPGATWTYSDAYSNSQGAVTNAIFNWTAQAGGTGITNFLDVTGASADVVSKTVSGFLFLQTADSTDTATFSPGLLFLPAASNAGDTFNSSGSITSSGASGTYSAAGQVIGLSSVTVPAGQFNALEIELTLTVTIQTAYGIDIQTNNYVFWFGKNIGIVKYTCSSTNTLAGTSTTTSFEEVDLLYSSLAGPSNAKDDCSSDCGQNAGDPINIRTGNSAQAQFDYHSSDGLLDFFRIYNSTVTQPHTVGAGWRHNYDQSLIFAAQPSPRLAVLTRADGKVLAFHEPAGGPGASGHWISDPDVNGQLTPTYSGNTTPVGWIFVNEANEVELYNSSGLLTGVTQARGGSGFSDRSKSGMTAIFFNDSRSISDETTETQPLTVLQGESGFGSLERREDDGAACCAL